MVHERGQGALEVIHEIAYPPELVYLYGLILVLGNKRRTLTNHRALWAFNNIFTLIYNVLPYR